MNGVDPIPVVLSDDVNNSLNQSVWSVQRVFFLIAFMAALKVLPTPYVSKVDAAESPLVHVEFTPDGGPLCTVSGRILVTAQDGGLLLQGRDGVLWNVTPKQLKSLKKTDETFKPLSSKELGKLLQAEFGNGFQIHTTKHYIICSDTGKAYTKWCGSLFERLKRAFRLHWRSTELKLKTPEFPLVAIIFRSRKSYARYATKDAGAGAANSLGYYSVRTNRIILFDLTSGAVGGAGNSSTDIVRKIQASPFNIATVIHEATHQIAFNMGMHTRYADNPLWLTEGMAMYFETPDLRSRQGWRTVGKLNLPRLRQFRDFQANRRQPDSLQTLIGSNKRLVSTETVKDAYAEAWALSYFLVKTRKKSYRKYLAEIAKKPQLIWDTPEERIALFKKTFGTDLKTLDREFLRYLARRRTR
jgi:hypothetical protein